MKESIHFLLIVLLVASIGGGAPWQMRRVNAEGRVGDAGAAGPQEQPLVFPALLKKEQQEAGNPLAAYAEMLRLEPEYLKSKIFARVYPEVRALYEENLGEPRAGVRAMSLPTLRGKVKTAQ